MQIIEHESIEDLQRLANQQRKGRVRVRFQGIVMARQGQTSAAIGKALGVASRTVRDWVKRYNEGGVASLQEQPRPGRPLRLEEADHVRFRERLDAGSQPRDGVCSLRGLDIQRILEEEFGVVYTLDGVYRLLRRLGYSSLMPRPLHARADPERQDAFKKSAR